MPDETLVSRRQFLKLAGVAGATIGVGASLGGLVAACGGETNAETTTTAAGVTDTTTAVGTEAAAGSAATSVAAGAEQGKGLKVGIVVPMTGPLAEFGAPTEYLTKKVEDVTGRWLLCGCRLPDHGCRCRSSTVRPPTPLRLLRPSSPAGTSRPRRRWRACGATRPSP